MTIEKRTFAEWEYPFIAQDYEDTFGVHKPEGILVGIVVETGDNLQDIMEAVNKSMDEKADAIMIELCHVEGTFLANDVVNYASSLLECGSYIDTESYESRMSYIKEW
jgi:hypothetical protein